MRKCQECRMKDWEIVVSAIKEEEGEELNIYQCKNCKRIVCTTQDDIEGRGYI